MSEQPTRQQALSLLMEFNRSEQAVNHALAVEAAMRHLAGKRGQDAETWGVVGLIHDLDYEQFPDQHCRKTVEILRARGWPEEIIRAAASHGWPRCSDIRPESDLEKALYAVDELTGLVAATALVRPSRSLMDLEPRSVLKKWKEKRFAAGVDRSVIEQGSAMLGVGLPELIADVIQALRGVADRIGLAGGGPPPAP